MDFRDIEEYQKLNRLKSKHNCLVCEVVVPEKMKEGMASVVYGEGGNIEMAILIDTLEKMANNLKKNFPKAVNILPIISEMNLEETYKRVEKKE